MSVRVNIEPAAVFKKPPVIQELLLPGWEYGTWDKGFSLSAWRNWYKYSRV